MAMSLIQDAQTRIRPYVSVPKRRFRHVYTSYLPDVRLPAYSRQQQRTTTTDRFDRIPLCNIPNSLDLAAALAGMSREEVDRTLSMSPPMSANNSASALYPGLQQAAAASAFGMLSPSQLLAANRQAAAAFMAAQLPTMSTLASTLFPHHPALFGSWASAAPHMPLSSGPHSPPASPHSPINVTSPSNGGKHSHGMISPPTTAPSELPLKKPRKLSVKKDLHSPPMEISAMNVSDLYSSSGPISPPSSGSSPNSTHDGHGHGHGHGHGQSNTVAAPTATGAHAKDPARDKSFTCKICSRSFGYKHVLQNHERTHTGEKPFECPECHKRFTRDHHLKTHMRLHTGEKPYHCSHCDRQFVQVANLRRHLRVHTGERPYTCEICDGKFSDSNQLKSHMLVHNGEKPFECERCHMKFRRRHHLLNHKCGSALLPGGSGMHSPPNSPCADINANTGGEYTLCDQKSVMGSSYGSEESMDVGRPANTSGSSYELMEQHGVIGAALHHHHSPQQQHHHQPLHPQHQQPHQHLVTAADTTSAVAVATEDEDDDDAPLDLSESDMGSVDGRKSHDIRRVFRLPPQIVHVRTEMPEQTEPEDLSVHRMAAAADSVAAAMAAAHSPDSMLMMHDDLDLDELDDAATLYVRQQQLQLAAVASLKGGIKME